MFENWKNLEGTYVNPILLEDRMTTLEEVKQKTRDKNQEVNEEILERLEIVEVNYLSKDNKVYKGQIVVDRDLVDDIKKLFDRIQHINNHANNNSEKFFIEKIIPISHKNYDGDDEVSMSDNNTSGFNDREIKGTKILSLHAFGFAIDINPRENPVIKEGEPNQPKNGEYDEKKSNTLTSSHKIVLYLQELDFEWGGEWNSDNDHRDYKDYQHFEKVIPTKEYIDNFLENVITSPNIEYKFVINRIEKLILNNTTDKKYSENLVNLINDQKVIDILGQQQSAFYLKLITSKS